LNATVAPLVGYNAPAHLPSEAQPSHFIVDGTGAADSLRQSLGVLTALDQEMSRVMQPVDDPWRDFLAHPADYLGWLTEFGFQTEDAAAAEGQLSAELIDRVRAKDL